MAPHFSHTAMPSLRIGIMSISESFLKAIGVFSTRPSTGLIFLWFRNWNYVYMKEKKNHVLETRLANILAVRTIKFFRAECWSAVGGWFEGSVSESRGNFVSLYFISQEIAILTDLYWMYVLHCHTLFSYHKHEPTEVQSRASNNKATHTDTNSVYGSTNFAKTKRGEKGSCLSIILVRTYHERVLVLKCQYELAKCLICQMKYDMKTSIAKLWHGVPFALRLIFDSLLRNLIKVRRKS